MRNSGKLDDDVDQLFQLPLAEFTGARNTLAARLKQSGRAADAMLVKTLAKPPVSAWTVNQLYWHHREAFDTLLAAGQRFHKAQTAGKVADMRAALEARREALTNLADLAASVLVEAGHNPSGDTIRRITTTLEAVSAYASLKDGPTLGRLTQDVDPPGFESLAGFFPGAAPAPQKTAAAKQKTPAPERKDDRKERELEETRQVRIAAAKLSLQAAKRSLADAKVRAQSMESAQKKAHAEAKQAEKQARDAEERFKRAKAASDAAAHQAKTIAAEAQEAAKAVEEAKRAIERASKELESSFSRGF